MMPQDLEPCANAAGRFLDGAVATWHSCIMSPQSNSGASPRSGRWGRRSWAGLAAGAAFLTTVGFLGVLAVESSVAELLRSTLERALVSITPADSGERVPAQRRERQASARLAIDLDAVVVWASNRRGQHDLYVRDIASGRQRRLTKHPHPDFFSRFSPDGERVVFMRGQRHNVSFREDNSWDVYLIDTDGKNERLLARHGYHPTWTSDGRSIVFLRAQEVYRIDVESSAEELLFAPPQDFPGSVFGDIELSPDGTHLAMGIKGFGTSVINLADGSLTALSQQVSACETTWSPQGDYLLWMETGGHGATRIMRGNSDGTRQQVLMDPQHEFNHEYFPKISNDGTWLIWGASAGGHEHDRADYEIFIWQIGTPPNQPIRLTFHSGNDAWPDVFVRQR